MLPRSYLFNVFGDEFGDFDNFLSDDRFGHKDIHRSSDGDLHRASDDIDGLVGGDSHLKQIAKKPSAQSVSLLYNSGRVTL